MRLVWAVFAALMLVAACTAGSGEGGVRVTESERQTVGADPAVVSAALEFGGIVLPASATVLGVQHDRGVDERYRVVLRLPEGDVAGLLSGSGFAAAPVADTGPFPATVDGFELEASAGTEAVSDSVSPGDGRAGTVFREVVVDRAGTEPVIHLWLFTT